jgi:hypothetical protein
MAAVRFRLDPQRIIAATMCIAPGPLQQALLSRWAVWWRGGGNPRSISCPHSAGVPPQNCMATSLIVANGRRLRSVEFEKVLAEPLLQDFQ